MKNKNIFPKKKELEIERLEFRYSFIHSRSFTKARLFISTQSNFAGRKKIMLLIELLNKTVASLIRFYKWVELMVIRAIPGYVEREVLKMGIQADVVLNGDRGRPWDIKVHNKQKFYEKSTNTGGLGMGESYVDKLFDCGDIAEMINRLMRSKAYLLYYTPWNRFLNWMELFMFNNQTKSKAFEVGQKHYDLGKKGNDLYQAMLDPYMQYTCGYWRTANNLEEAQRAKMDLVAKKLMLKPGMKVLDMGCGFGGLSKYLAENYGVSCVGVTVSKEQVEFSRELCKGLPVDIKLMDYRDLPENKKFDRIASIGMFEHVGHHNHHEFFDKARSLLKDDGLLLLHCIGVNHHDFPCMEPFVNTYLFPNTVIPYYKNITDEIEKKFVIEDWHNFGHDYSRTLLAWHANFTENWPKLQGKYGERFYRMWRWYLLFCCGCFRARKLNLWQVVLSKDGIQGGYYAAR